MESGAKRSSDTSPEVHDRPKRSKLYHRNQEEFHEFDVFCHSLAIQLKNMSLERALLCQEKLQQVMTQERLGQLSKSHETSDDAEVMEVPNPESPTASPCREVGTIECEQSTEPTGFDVKQEKIDSD